MRRILVASLLAALSTSAFASSSSSSANVPMTSKVSTGVIAPKVIEAVKVELPNDAVIQNFANHAQVVVSVTVGADGKAQDVHVTKSLTKQIDDQVVAAVRQFRFAPATLDNQAVTMSMNLTVVLQR